MSYEPEEVKKLIEENEKLQVENDELKVHIKEILNILQKHHTETVLEAAAEKAKLSGSKKDLDTYLALRRENL